MQNNMSKELLFSVIIPHRNSLDFLPKLFSTIPNDDRLEIILVDNSPTPISKGDIAIDREYILLHSGPERGAGGARNVGIENARGKWLIFADADDYFSDTAFDLFFSKADSDAEIIYTCMGGVFLDTGEPSDRGDQFTKKVQGYLNGTLSELDLRTGFASPCCKMVSSSLVKRHSIRYDEVVAHNDNYFSLLSGFYAKKIEAIDSITYIATVNRGSLTRRRDYPVVYSRFWVTLKRNKFLKEHHMADRQGSVMVYLYQALHFGPIVVCKMLLEAFRWRQNIFVGWRRWIRTFANLRKQEKKESKYIVK